MRAETRVVQIHGRRRNYLRYAAGSRKVWGSTPRGLLRDLLALVGDAADGYPGIPGIGVIDCHLAFESLR